MLIPEFIDFNEEYDILWEGKAIKLKINSKDHVYYKIGLHKQEQYLTLAICGNDGPGLFSKEWIKLEDINQILEKEGHYFSSSAFKELFKSKSRNNSGFLTAILKSNNIGFIEKTIGYQYQYQVVKNYEEVYEAFNKHWIAFKKVSDKNLKNKKKDSDKEKKGQEVENESES